MYVDPARAGREGRSSKNYRAQGLKAQKINRLQPLPMCISKLHLLLIPNADIEISAIRLLTSSAGSGSYELLMPPVLVDIGH